MHEPETARSLEARWREAANQGALQVADAVEAAGCGSLLNRMPEPRVNIVIPHFQTPELVKLCLRLLRHFRNETAMDVTVVDNASTDGQSLAYLRSVGWIRLIERHEGVAPRPAPAHGSALDMGIAAGAAPFILAMHTDAFPLCDGWLDWMVRFMDGDAKLAALGTDQLPGRSPARRLFNRVEHWARRLIGKHVPPDRRPFVRTHCALYRREALERLGLCFTVEQGDTVGREVHMALERHGLRAHLLAPGAMIRRVTHLDHATSVLVYPQFSPAKVVRRGRRTLDAFLATPLARAVLSDESLDR